MSAEIPPGNYTGHTYGVFAWDEGDRDVECIVATPSLSVARDAYRKAQQADPAYDHLEIVKRVETFGPWEPDAHATRIATGAAPASEGTQPSSSTNERSA